MNLKITINMDNAAFGETHGERSAEAARILRGLADGIRRSGLYGRVILDRDGNTVGAVVVNRTAR